MATLRLFATVRVAAGTGKATFEGSTVGEILDSAVVEYGPEFETLVPLCRIWVNGKSADRDVVVGPTDEVALLPPVSGG